MEICLWLDWLIFDFVLNGCPTPFSFALFFLLSPALEWENGKSAHWISSGWLGLSQRTPVDPACQMCLSIGVNSKIHLLGLWGFVGVDRRCRGVCCPLAKACHSYCLFLYPSLSVDCWCWCLMTLPVLWWHISYHVPPEINLITQGFDWHFSMSYFVMITKTLAPFAAERLVLSLM